MSRSRRHYASSVQALPNPARYLVQYFICPSQFGHQGSNMEGIIRAWGKILTGYRPNLSIEITRECPLTCPGCYAYGSDHLGGDVKLRELQDFKGQQLVDAMFALLAKHKPLHVSIVGGEPLVRYRELNAILPRMAARGIYTQVVTSA